VRSEWKVADSIWVSATMAPPFRPFELGQHSRTGNAAPRRFDAGVVPPHGGQPLASAFLSSHAS
jgi:hypothetical protein